VRTEIRRMSRIQQSRRIVIEYTINDNVKRKKWPYLRIVYSRDHIITTDAKLLSKNILNRVRSGNGL